jgi:hypothetical protein
LTSLDLSGNELTSSCGEKLGAALLVQAQNMHKYQTLLAQLKAKRTYKQQQKHTQAAMQQQQGRFFNANAQQQQSLAEAEEDELPAPPPQLVKLNLNTNPIGPVGIKKITDALVSLIPTCIDINLHSVQRHYEDFQP